MTSQGRAHVDGRRSLDWALVCNLHKLLKLHCYDGGTQWGDTRQLLDDELTS